MPILTLKKPDRTRWDDRKLDHVRPYLERAEAEGRAGVVAIVATQEFQWVFSAKNRSTKPSVVSFDFELATNYERPSSLHSAFDTGSGLAPVFLDEETVMGPSRASATFAARWSDFGFTRPSRWSAARARSRCSWRRRPGSRLCLPNPSLRSVLRVRRT